MATVFQWLRSVLFTVQMYSMMVLLAVLFLPFALVSSGAALMACHAYCRWVVWSAGWMVGLKVEIRGVPPEGECMVAAKHQALFETLALFSALPRPKFIMKRELMFAPIFGQYAWRVGCVPVARGRRGHAIRKMMEDVSAGLRNPGQLVIYPQGTRVAPGDYLPYKIGTGLLYEQLGQECHPVATNAGVFWPKRGLVLKSGTAVLEFLPPIPAGRPKEEMLEELESLVERRSNALMREAGFPAPGPRTGGTDST